MPQVQKKQQTKQLVVPDPEESQLFSKGVPQGIAPGDGSGISNEADDNQVPFISVLHFLSPQVESNDDRYIDGARPGMIWLRNCQDGPELVSGDEGLLWQQCWFKRVWLEWRPREDGGGIVGRFNDVRDKRYKSRPDLEDAVPPEPGEFDWTDPKTGFKIALNKVHVGHVLGRKVLLPYVINYKGAGLSESKTWMASMPRERPDGTQAAAWDFAWRLKTVFKERPQGKWYDLRATRRLPDMLNAELNVAGRRLFEQFSSGELRPEEEAGDKTL